MASFEKVGIVGFGNYGTAIAQCFSGRVKKVIGVADSEAVASNVNELRMNLQSLPGILLNENISCSCDFSKLRDCDVVFLAAPATALADVCNKIKEYEIKAPLVLCSKGFDVENGRLQSDLLEEILDNECAIFSGPSFAHEIAQGLPAGVNIASQNNELAQKISESFCSETFKVEALDDYIGLQVCGALKNVLAIGCGIFSGLKLGDNAAAKLIVDGCREMSTLAVALGGKKETLLELGGIGDTILTCASKRSRNIMFGEHLAGGGTVDDWAGSLAEGAYAAKAIPMFERKHNVSLPIFSEIYQIIHGKKSLFDAVSEIARM